ncbi:DNA integrity scanning protein DisA [Candidatus Woesearchaeota archaeon]|nr:DNA integrity scanning protein DisA [Candidatus Woesearchaeota archaeon]
MVDEKKDVQVELIKNNKENKNFELSDALKLITPGTSLRTAIEGVKKAKTGGLIVVYNDKLENLFEGGFKINSKFTPQRIIELGKMDGAIILSKDLKKILYANVLLTPNNSLPSNETGTRHKAAERIAKQTGTVVVCISQRRDEISLFYGNLKYIIRETDEIIRRASSILQIIEKHREIFDKNLNELNSEEIKKKPRIIKALYLIQRGMILIKVSNTLKDYLIELGNEGIIVKSRLRELLYSVEEQLNLTLKDYSKIGFLKSYKILSLLSYDDLLNLDNIKECLGISEDFCLSRGFRILTNNNLAEENISILVSNFKNLQTILDLKKENLTPLFGEEKTDIILDKISHIKTT